MSGSFLLHSDDLGETEEILGANFGRIRINAKAAGSSTKARIWRRNVGPFHVDEAEFGYEMSFDMDPPPRVMVCRVRSGAIEEGRSDARQRFGPGRVAAFGAHAGVPFSGMVDRARYDLIEVERHLLGEVAGDQSVRLTSSEPVSDDANQMLLDAFDYLRHGVLANPHAMQSELMAGAASRYLAASVLSAFPHTTSPMPSAEGPQESNCGRFRQAIAFIDDYANTDISLADIAVAADTTPRSLRYLFRRYRDCTPMEYLHTVRLHHAHHDIEAGLGATATVAEVAHRWGFLDVHRFTDDYLRTYGHLPRTIVRQNAVATNGQ